MPNINQPEEKKVSFRDFLLKERHKKLALIIAATAIVIQFVLFKYFYPFASYIHGDSFSYIDAAYLNRDISTYMIGYSRFLRFFSVFTTSDLALTAFQYLLVQVSALFFLSTLFYFYRPGKIIQGILFCFMICNPLFLHMGNMISSDCLFLSLSLLWLSLLLWLLHQSSITIIIWHSVILCIVFTLRYNALIYPVIAAFVFLFSTMPLRNKLAGIFTGLTLCGSFITYTTFKYHQETAYWQYSPFSGWQWANNAMYTYRYVDNDDRKPVPERFRELDNMITQYFDSTRDTKKFPHEAAKASTAYMWSHGLPLWQYREKTFARTDSTAKEFKRWASMGPFFGAYGKFIIKQYPSHFIRHFVWPNAHKYYAPPVEFLDIYNSGQTYVTETARQWFNYTDTKVTARTKNLEVHILDFYPILTGTMNIVFLASLICFILLKGFRKQTHFRQGIALITFIWLVNAGFTILASSAALRFQAFPVLLVTTFALLLIDWIAHYKVEEITHLSN